MKLLRIPLVWLTTGAVVTAPVWLVMGVWGFLIGLLGPFGILLFKPGENVLDKLILAALMSLPTAIGAAVVTWRWLGMSTRSRTLSVIVLSTLWHGITAALWRLILTGFN